jgi:hypothetical protein
MESKRALLSKTGERWRDPSFLTGKQTIDSGKGKGAKEKIEEEQQEETMSIQ